MTAVTATINDEAWRVVAAYFVACPCRERDEDCSECRWVKDLMRRRGIVRLTAYGGFRT